MFKDCKSGGYNLEDSNASVERLTSLAGLKRKSRSNKGIIQEWQTFHVEAYSMKETTPAAMPPCFDRWCKRFDDIATAKAVRA
jgi:hypothetical protein